jgi:predicted Fe-Mo cluster-binding NifX family protein
MKIAIAATGRSIKSEVANHTGRALWFILYDTSTESYEALDNSVGLECLHWAGKLVTTRLVEAGARVVITRRIGPKALGALKNAGIEVYLVDHGPATLALRSFREGTLSRTLEPNCLGHIHASK